MSEPGAALTAPALVNPGERIDVAESTALRYGDCAWCGALFVARDRGRASRTVCSKRCRNARAKSQRDPADVRAAQRRYRESHPEKFRWSDGKKAAYHRRRARKKTGSTGERVVPAEVFARDGWRCGIYGGKVDRDLVYPHHRSSSLDHIIPLSKGGEHSYANVQLAHLGCNLSKRDSVEGVQPRLIG